MRLPGCSSRNLRQYSGQPCSFPAVRIRYVKAAGWLPEWGLLLCCRRAIQAGDERRRSFSIRRHFSGSEVYPRPHPFLSPSCMPLSRLTGEARVATIGTKTEAGTLTTASGAGRLAITTCQRGVMSKRSDEARLRAAAEYGDVNAANDLADLLEEAGDMAGAERWYRFAAAAGDMKSAADLGRMLWTREALEEAELWLRKAATSNDPEDPMPAQYGAALLGKCLIDLAQPQEAEQWLIIGADAGLDFAVEALERLRRAQARRAHGGPGSDVLQTFEVDSVMFYDGTGHRLGPSVCTLTRTRLLIDDAYGGISQIRLRDINGVSTPGRLVSPKMFRITVARVAYDIYCINKDQKYLFEAWLSEAIHEA
jgi:hypothetical protein